MVASNGESRDVVPGRKTVPVDGPTPRSIWAAQVGLDGLLKTEGMNRGTGG